MSYTITDKCIGCTMCAKNCPVGAISGALKEMHTIDKDICVDCGVCAKVCKPGAILDKYGRVAKPVDKKEWKKPVISQAKCYGCSLCIIECGFDCISITKPRYRGDIHTYAELSKPEKCVGCSLCFEVCPMDAIKMV